MDSRTTVRNKRNDYTAELRRYGLAEEVKEIDSIFKNARFLRYRLRRAASRAILLANWRLKQMAVVYYTAIVNHLKSLYQSDLTKHFGGDWNRLDEWAADVLVKIRSELKQQKSAGKLLNDANVVEMFENFEKSLRQYREEVCYFLLLRNFDSTDNAF